MWRKVVAEIESIKLFRCFLCQKFKPMTPENCKSVIFKDLLWPKDVCIECFEKVKKEGVIGA
jgi:hypothetical protein